MKKRIYYSTLEMSEFRTNCCHSGLCSFQDYRRCRKHRKCQIRVCGWDERKLFGQVSINDIMAENKKFKRFVKKEDKWRREEFKRCKPVLFTIKRIKGGVV